MRELTDDHQDLTAKNFVAGLIIFVNALNTFVFPVYKFLDGMFGDRQVLQEMHGLPRAYQDKLFDDTQYCLETFQCIPTMLPQEQLAAIRKRPDVSPLVNTRNGRQNGNRDVHQSMSMRANLVWPRSPLPRLANLPSAVISSPQPYPQTPLPNGAGPMVPPYTPPPTQQQAQGYPYTPLPTQQQAQGYVQAGESGQQYVEAGYLDASPVRPQSGNQSLIPSIPPEYFSGSGYEDVTPSRRR